MRIFTILLFSVSLFTTVDYQSFQSGMFSAAYGSLSGLHSINVDVVVKGVNDRDRGAELGSISGNEKTLPNAACFSTVTTADGASCTLQCQADVTKSLDASGNASISPADIGSISSVDCGILSVSPSTFTCTDLGANTVFLTLTKDGAPVNSCFSTVTILDGTSSNLSCFAEITRSLDASGNASISPADIGSTTSFDCGILSVSPSAFTCANLGDNFVTLTLTKDGAPVNSCFSTVTILDGTSSNLSCFAEITRSLDASGNASISPADIGSTTSFDCGILSVSPSTFTCADLGSNTVFLTLTKSDGSMNSCFSVVNVEDNSSSTLACQGTFNASLDACGYAIISAEDISTSPSICGVLEVVPSVFTCADLGAQFATVTLTSSNGSTNSCFTTVNVSGSCGSFAEDAEYKTLLALYNETDGGNWTDNTGWLSTCDPCDEANGGANPWYGITCDGSYNVVGISLANNNLQGTIAGELGSLVNLTSLTLNNNNLSGCYPQQLVGLCLNAGLSLTDAMISDGTGLPSWEDFCSDQDNACCPTTLEVDWEPVLDGDYKANGDILVSSDLSGSTGVTLSIGAGKKVTVPAGSTAVISASVVISEDGCN